MNVKRKEQQQAVDRVIQVYGQFGEWICYGDDDIRKVLSVYIPSELEKSVFDEIITGYRRLFGQYLKKGIPFERISIQDYARALSPDCMNGALITARKYGFIPEYQRYYAKKFRIKAGCCGVNTDC